MAFDGDIKTFTVTALPDPKSLTTARERLGYMEAFLRALKPSRFVMHTYSCGTAACIAGWCVRQFGGEMDFADQEAAARLGLSDLTMEALFRPDGWLDEESAFTPKQAANVIAHLLKTGEVDWSVGDDQ